MESLFTPEILVPALGGLCCLLLLGLLLIVVVVLVLRARRGRQDVPTSHRRRRPQGPPARWTVVVVQGEDEGKHFPLHRSLRIGRAPDNEVQLQDGMISRHHAHIVAQEDACYVADLESANGTFVNGEQISESVWLLPEDEIQVGDTVLRLEER
jgi:hypothetical protein